MVFHALTARKNNTRRPTDGVRTTEHALTEANSADAWYNAALNLPNIQDRLAHLQRALSIDPFHQAAAQAWDASAREASRQPHTLPLTRSGRLAGVIEIFTQRGWELMVELPQMAQLRKRRRVAWRWALALILPLNVVGLALVVWLSRSGGWTHLHIQLERDGRLLAMSSRHSETLSDAAQLIAIAQAVRGGVTGWGALALWALSCGLWAVLLTGG